MAFWAAIPMIASMGAQALGGEQARESTIEGARTQAEIERLKRDYAQRTFEEDIERQKPFYEAGKQAGVLYPDAIVNKLDPTVTGAYQLQKRLIEPELEGAPEYVKESAMQQLGAIEQQKQKSRLMDIQQIGLGAAGAAGTAGLNLGNILAQSYGLTGQVSGGAKQSAAEQRQSAWNVAASQLSGLPAYFAAGRQPTQTYDTYMPGQQSLGLMPGQRIT